MYPSGGIMIKSIATLLLFVLTLPGWAQSNADREKMTPDTPMLGPQFARGEAHARHNQSPNLIYHNGDILPSTVTASIFWGASWTDPIFVSDKISGLDIFYQGVGGSDYAKTCDEYTDSSGPVTKSISYIGHLIDTSAAPAHPPRTSTVLQEVCSVLAAHGVTPVANGYYAVYIDTPRHNANYCAWHSYGSCNNVPVEFGFFFNLDNDPGCDPQDTIGVHSQGLAALANVTGHELSEARTDPRGAGWYDSSGAENSDKCAWVFGTPLIHFSNHSEWKIQGNWSNAAYSGSFGYLNRGGQPGCLDGGNYPAVAP